MRLAILGGLVCAVSACTDLAVDFNVSYDDRYPAARLDLYRPFASAASPRPGILFIHGGAWITSQKEHFGQPATRFARGGYVTANMDYRLAPGAPYPAAIQDAWCALAYFRSRSEELGMDPSRVAVFGYSAGGHLAALLGLGDRPSPHAPDCAAGNTAPANAVVAGAGVYDLSSLPDVPALRDFLGGGRTELAERYAEASPVNHVAGEGNAPFLLVHGTADLFVSAEQASLMKARLTEAGTPAELLTLHSAGHVLNASQGGSEVELELSTELPESYLAISDFLVRTLGAPP